MKNRIAWLLMSCVVALSLVLTSCAQPAPTIPTTPTAPTVPPPSTAPEPTPVIPTPPEPTPAPAITKPTVTQLIVTGTPGRGGEEQFYKAIEFGFIPANSIYVPFPDDYWGFYTEGTEEYETLIEVLLYLTSNCDLKSTWTNVQDATYYEVTIGTTQHTECQKVVNNTAVCQVDLSSYQEYRRFQAYVEAYTKDGILIANGYAELIVHTLPY